MSEREAENAKQAKKLAKAGAKAAKKQAKAERAATNGRGPLPSAAGDSSAEERSARAAEKKLALERWRTVAAAIGSLVALATLLLALRGACQR